MSIAQIPKPREVLFMQHEQQFDIEPGLLNALRVYTFFGVGIGVSIWAASLVRGQIDAIVLVSLLLTLPQLVLLFVPQVAVTFGRYYLPLVLVYITVQLVLSDWITYAASVMGASVMQVEFDVVSMYLMLLLSPPYFFLALLISWQYTVRDTLLFAVVTAVPAVVFHVHIAQLIGQSNEFVLIAILFRATGFLTIGYFVTHLMKQQRRLRRELNDANRQIARYASMTESLAISRERNRMARELHDTLAHTLTSSTVQLQAATTLWDINPAKSRELVERSLDINRTSLDETRRALHDLRATPLENMGLLLAIRELGEMTARRTGRRVEMHLPEQLSTLPEAVEQTVYRVVQEALENIVRHAHATQITVKMVLQRDMLSLRVDDDGQGFNIDEIHNERRYGIQGMRERIHALGGTLEIHSRLNAGTQVRFAIQVQE